MKQFSYAALLLLSGYLFFSLFFSLPLPEFAVRVSETLSSVFFADSLTETELKERYRLAQKGGEKVKILLVPGHEANEGGSEFRGMREAALNMQLAERLSALLLKNPQFEVTLSRSGTGTYPALWSYLHRHEEDIWNFVRSKAAIMKELQHGGTVERVAAKVNHNNAPSDAVLTLYGINAWANENGFDVILHIHFNDYPRPRNWSEAGEHSGFAIYIPERQYSNARVSRAVAKSVFDALSKFYPTSDLPKEKGGFIESPDLIAVGAYNTVDPVSFLIEYAYIYEPQLATARVRSRALDDLAFQTALGLERFFEGRTMVRPAHDTSLIPYEWRENLKEGMKYNADIFSLQAALALEDLYPPKEKSKNECPLSGNFGPCTRVAVEVFQKKYDIEPVTGEVGAATRAKLNELYSE